MEATLCSRGCGFYGSPSTNNLCSKCYRESLNNSTTSSNTTAPVVRNQQQEANTTTATQQDLSSLAEPNSSNQLKMKNGDKSGCMESVVMITERNEETSDGSCVLVQQVTPEQPQQTYNSDFMNNNNNNVPLNIHTSTTSTVNIVPVSTASQTQEKVAFHPTTAISKSVPAASGLLSVQLASDASSTAVPGDRSPTLTDAPEECIKSNVYSSVGRCIVCNKKIGLVGFTCRCGSSFCAVHRYPDAHSCTFDYATYERDKLAKANPKVVAEKVTRL